MAKEISKQALSLFEQIKQTDENGYEYWAARQLAKVLEYTDFRNFFAVFPAYGFAQQNKFAPVPLLLCRGLHFAQPGNRHSGRVLHFPFAGMPQSQLVPSR